jgi:hypothetical protein
MLILWSILGWIVPLIILVWIIRAFTHRGHHGKTRQANYRDLLLATVGLSAGYAGAAAIYYLPPALFGSDSDNAVFASRLVIGVLLLIAGIALKKLTGVFLMIMGLVAFTLAAPFVFNNLGSAGALVAAFVAFIALVVFAMRINKKADHHG